MTMSELPALPSSMQKATLMVAGAENADAEKALTAPVQLNLTLEQGFQARDRISAGKKRELEEYAPKLVCDPDSTPRG
jgi:hypothetical protein